jgi:preprotein translocase subunit SecB
MQNIQKSAFSIVSYKFDKVSLDLSNHKNSELSLAFDTSGNFSKEESKYDLSFKVNVFNEQKEIPFVMVQCIGTFKFENVSSIEEIPDFFYRNCIAILFPYVRAYVSLVTTQANVPSIILPTLNLSNLEETLRNNTTQN